MRTTRHQQHKTSRQRSGLTKRERDRYLAQQIREGSDSAAWELAMHYAGLAHSQARLYMTMCYGAGYDDLKQQAVIGLLESARRYDPDRGSFARAAKYGIRHSIIRYLINNCGEIRIPVKSRDCLIRADKGEEIDEKSSRAADRARFLIEADFFTKPVSEIRADGADGGRLHEYGPLDVFVRKEDVSRVRKCLARLSRRERFVLRAMFFDDMTYKDIGRQMSSRGLTDRPLSREAVGQCRLRALRKMREMLTETE